MAGMSITNPNQSGTLGADLMPWLDYASPAVPDNHAAILWWGEYLWFSCSSYRMSLSRIADYFLTEVDFPDEDSEEEDQYRDLLDNGIRYRSSFKAAGEELLAYGNVVLSCYQPFRRMMICRKCRFEQPFRRAKPTVKLSPSAPFVVWGRPQPCRYCGDTRDFHCVDRPDPDIDRVKLVTYCPRDLDLTANFHSGRKAIWLKTTSEVYRDVNTGADIHIEDTPLEMLEAVAQNVPFRFDEDQVLHYGMPALSGLRMHGWGLSPMVSSFRDAWLSQMYNKADQAVAVDYTLGIRVMSPAPTPGGSDPMQLHGSMNFVESMKGMVRRHREDPTRVHVAPHPINYQFMGGEGANLITPDKLKFRQGEFLNGIGIPAEFYQMNLTVQAAPMALRLFENSWQCMPAFYNQVLRFVIRQVSQMRAIKPTKAIMKRTVFADDAERKQILAQLMAANQISPQTFLECLGINAKAEVRKVFRHQELTQEIQKEFDERAQDDQEADAMSSITGQPTPSTIAAQLQGQGSSPGGGLVTAGQPGSAPGQPGAPAPAPGGDPASQSLLGLSGQADQTAQQLLAMPDGPRKTELKKIRESNKDFHSLVMGAMDRMRGDATSQGRQQALQQMQQPGQQPAPAQA